MSEAICTDVFHVAELVGVDHAGPASSFSLGFRHDPSMRCALTDVSALPDPLAAAQLGHHQRDLADL